MWIGEFSAAAGLGVATVRFYVKSGLLHPKLGATGGSRPYMYFSPKDLRLVAAIRTGQAMGMSLVEIKALVDERRAAGPGRKKMLQTMTAHREKLGQRVAELEALIQFVDAKIVWLQAGSVGPVPEPQKLEHRFKND
jgi:MerR family Zn(II)-responsive transcriptional regulator of zntA